MKTITYKEKEYELKYTYNSFRYMEEFDIEDLNIVESKPFKIIPIVMTLLTGALNYNPNKPVKLALVNEILEDVIENGNIQELFTDLIDCLQDSNFFKNLQKENIQIVK